MSNDKSSHGIDDRTAGHPSQAEGEDSDDSADSHDPFVIGHPSQAEGEDDEEGTARQ